MRGLQLAPTASILRICLVATLLLVSRAPCESLSFVESHRALFGARFVTVAPDGRHVYASSSSDDAVMVFERDGATGELDFVQSHFDGVNGVEGLGSVNGLVVSPNGRHVYASSSSDHAVVAFERDRGTGELVFVEVHYDALGGVDGIGGALDVALSPDGRHLYVASFSDNAVAVFSRDRGSGRLSFVEALFDDTDGVEGLSRANSVAVSPDGNHVYATGQVDDSVAVFEREAASGRLSFVEAQLDGSAGIDGLDSAAAVALSPDGRHAYVCASGDDAVTVFEREAASGRLELVEIQVDGTNGVDGLDLAAHVVVSPDGGQVYVASINDDALALFDRDPTSGTLSFVEAWFDGVGGIDGLRDAVALAVSPDGRHVYAAGGLDRNLAVLERSAASGRLAAVEAQPVGLAAIDGANSVASSPDGHHVYVTGSGALSWFERDQTSGTLRFLDAVSRDLNGVDDFQRVRFAVVSPDGRHVYVANAPISSSDPSFVAAFERDGTSGALRFIATQDEGVRGEGIFDIGRMAMSPDGAHLYVTLSVSHQLTVLERDTTSGELSFVEAQVDGVNGVSGLRRPRSAAVSPDGRHVYVASADAVTYFDRDARLGALRFAGTLAEGMAGVERLRGANSVALSPDGRHVYVTSVVDRAVVLFERNPTAGSLDFVEAQVHGFDGIDGLRGVKAGVVSPDGGHLYAVGTDDDALVVFKRDRSDGTLEFAQVLFNGMGPIHGLDGAGFVAVSPDSRHVFVTGSEYVGAADSLVVFEAAQSGGCQEEPGVLCLLNGRFRVEIDWRDFANNTGSGEVALNSENAGVFWFFNAGNWEMLVKVLDGCAVNGHYWVFAASVTNVEFRLRVIDTETGMTNEYLNPLGSTAAAVSDTDAFATCP